MRGPSSSHSAASVRIGRIARDLCGGDPDSVLVQFDTEGSLATTHDSQGSDIGLFSGLLGWEADDERLPRSRAALDAAGIGLEIRIETLHDTHPNTYRLTLEREGITTRLVALSTGGGMIEVVEIDGVSVSLFGDYSVTLIDLEPNAGVEAAQGAVAALRASEEAVFDAIDAATPLNIVVEGQVPLTEAALAPLAQVARVRRIQAVLPVLSRKNASVPFLHAGEMTEGSDPLAKKLSDYALEYETARGGIDEEAVLSKMRRLLEIMKGGVSEGLAGTEYDDRILPRQSRRFAEMLQRGQLIDAGLMNRAILYVTALMEVKSSMGVFVAAPTAGSCGTFAGTCIAAAEARNESEDVTLRAMLAGGLIGVFTATRSSFAAEVGGCQAETGAGAAMAAAALVEMAGGNAAQALGAASHAFQNVLGLVCDPVANRVEAPCLGRNVAGASNAIASANMALAGFLHLIPLDEVLDAHREISENMARELRCTALGGLSTTPTSKAIEAKLCGAGGCGSC